MGSGEWERCKVPYRVRKTPLHAFWLHFEVKVKNFSVIWCLVCQTLSITLTKIVRCTQKIDFPCHLKEARHCLPCCVGSASPAIWCTAWESCIRLGWRHVTSGQACRWLSACCRYQWYAEIGHRVTGSLPLCDVCNGLLCCSDGDTNALCYAVEAVLLHGLKTASYNKPNTWVCLHFHAIL